MKRYAMVAAFMLQTVSTSANAADLEWCLRHLFKNADANSDGVLSPKEAAANPLRMDSTVFRFVDENGDGAISYEEYAKGTFVSCEVCPAVKDCATQ